MFRSLIHIRKSFEVQMESRQWWNGKVQGATCISVQKIRSYCLYLNNPFPCIVTAGTPLFICPRLRWPTQKIQEAFSGVQSTWHLPNCKYTTFACSWYGQIQSQGKKNSCYQSVLLLPPFQCFFFQSNYRCVHYSGQVVLCMTHYKVLNNNKKLNLPIDVSTYMCYRVNASKQFWVLYEKWREKYQLLFQAFNEILNNYFLNISGYSEIK